MAKMAEAFGVSEAYIDNQLHQLVAANQLHCRIDGVRGLVEMLRTDRKNKCYRTVIR